MSRQFVADIAADRHDVIGMIVAHLAASQTEPVHCEHNHDHDTIEVWLGATQAVSFTMPNASISFDAVSADGKLIGQVFADATGADVIDIGRTA